MYSLNFVKCMFAATIYLAIIYVYKCYANKKSGELLKLCNSYDVLSKFIKLDLICRIRPRKAADP